MSVNKNVFNSIPLNAPRRNVFDMSHDHKLSCNMGELIPVMTTEVIPGDFFTIRPETLVRFQPLMSPVMHRFDVSIHFFYVPNRILWPGWEDWIKNDGATTPPAFPYFIGSKGSAVSNPLMDYLGIPSTQTGSGTQNLSALPLAAYQAIWAEYYRDNNLIPEYDYVLGNGNQGSKPGIATLRRRAWEHDYFTSALPWAQRGAAIEMPVGDVTLKQPWTGNTPKWLRENHSAPSSTGDLNVLSGSGTPSVGGENVAYDPGGSLEVTSGTISDFRRAMKLQEWLERLAVSGNRYKEFIQGMFGVDTGDARVDRPEYITGLKSPVVISEVLNTAAGSGTGARPQGDMAGHAVSVGGGSTGGYYVKDFGFIMGVMSVMPKTAYYQGIPKHFLKTKDPFQYYFDQFAHIGEQPIENQELYAFESGGFPTAPFGYTPRYAEYKFQQNRVSGDFCTTLKHWHAAREFATPPALNQTFVEADPTHRIFAVTTPTVDKVLVQCYFDVKAVRPMAKYGVPSF